MRAVGTTEHPWRTLRRGGLDDAGYLPSKHCFAPAASPRIKSS